MTVFQWKFLLLFSSTCISKILLFQEEFANPGQRLLMSSNCLKIVGKLYVSNPPIYPSSNYLYLVETINLTTCFSERQYHSLWWQE